MNLRSFCPSGYRTKETDSPRNDKAMYHPTYKNPLLRIVLIAAILALPIAAYAAVGDPPATRRAQAVTPTPTPEPKKRGFLGRIFGGGEAQPTPTPATKEEIDRTKIKRAVPTRTESPTPTPKPKAKTKPKPKPKSTPKPEPDDSATPKPAAEEKATPEETAPPKSTPTPKPTPKPAPTPKPTAEPKSTPTPEPKPTASAQPESTFNDAPAFVPEADATPSGPAVEDILSEEYQKMMQKRYDSIKAKATSDEKIAALKTAAESAPPEQEKDALTSYYKALFDRMRELDPEMGTRVDRIEKATLSRIQKM